MPIMMLMYNISQFHKHHLKPPRPVGASYREYSTPSGFSAGSPVGGTQRTARYSSSTQHTSKSGVDPPPPTLPFGGEEGENRLP